MVGITRRDVVLCDLNPVVSTEQAGIRPVVIVQIDRARFKEEYLQPYYYYSSLNSKLTRS